MVSKNQGRSIIKELVERYSFVDDNRQLIRDRLLSEQDITIKFVLPMLEALNWNPFEITDKGPEIHEKAFREKSDVGKGLPDITLKSENGTVFVEVKRPGEISRGLANLKRYEDADLIVLTSFEDLEVYTRYKKDKPRLRQKFNVQEYVTEFDKLWNILSNTAKGKDTRAAYRATR